MLQERIEIGSTEGAGKTYAWLTIAANCPKNKFYVIDPDDGVRRVWYNEFKDVNNIEYYFTPKWFHKGFDGYRVRPTADLINDGSGKKNIFKSGIADAWKLIKPKIKEGDWLISEHMHLIWNSSQEMFADEIFDKEIGNYFLERRKAMDAGSKKLEAFQGWTDWSVINKAHNDDFINDICFDNPGHVFMTTSTSMSQPGAKEDADIKAFYGDTSIRFDGQKHVVFRVQTKMIFKVTGRGKDRKYIMNTFLKDRGREHVEEQEWSDYYWDYLVPIAGWLPE